MILDVKELQAMETPKIVDVYLEIGKNRTFAGAIDWPGWCRSGKDEQSALQALLDYGPRYAQALRLGRLEFTPPADVSALHVIERLPGSSTTDFGAPDAVPARDRQPVDESELRRFQALLQACWQALDAAAERAVGKELRKGPRGGGREADEIVRHVWMAERGYLSRLGVKPEADENADLAQVQESSRQAILEGVARSAWGELPTRGPRGGVIWGARYFVRRAAWHILDHTWEIEDKIIPV